MTFQLIDHPSAKSPNMLPKAELLALIGEYEACSDALEKIADQVPTSLLEAERLDREEAQLHDKRAELLGQVTDHDPKSLDDVKALLRLWHLEKIVEQPKSALNVSDRLVLKICEFLDIA